MPDPRDSLRIERLDPVDGLEIVRHAPPPGAASFSATFVGPGGWAFDPPHRDGLARMVDQVAACAGGTMDRVALARRLDRAGATVAHQTAPESAELSIWGPAAIWPKLLGILAEIALRPRFDPADIARVRRQALERQLREASQPGARADRELLRAIFPVGHPYRSTGTGDRRSIERISRADLVRFHRDRYAVPGALLVVTAPASGAEVERVVRRSFGGRIAGAAPAIEPPEAGRIRGQLPPIEIDLPGRSQVEVRLGGPTIARSDPGYPAAFLANELLGGRPLLSRLFQRVRERSGLAYHASSALEAMRWGGYWVAQAGTGSERWRRVVPMVVDEVDRLRTRAVGPAELRRIRESAIGEIPLALESTAESHELAVDVAYHGLPDDHWVAWPATLRSIGPEAVRAAAETAFDARAARTVVVGPIGRR